MELRDVVRPNGIEIELHQLLEDFVVRFLRDRREALTMRTPQSVNDEGSGEHSRRHVGIDVAKLARFDAALDDRYDQSMAACHDLVRVEPREVGIVVNLGVNESKERREIRCP